MKADFKEILLQFMLMEEEDQKNNPLTPKQEEILLRVKSLLCILDKHRIKSRALKIHQELWKLKYDKEVSLQTAYRDLDIAEHIQGNMLKTNVQFERYAMGEWQKEEMVKAAEAGNTAGFNHGMANYIKIKQLDKPDPIQIDHRLIQPVQPIFGFFTELFTEHELPPEDELQREIEALLEPAKFKKNKGEYVDFEVVPQDTD